MRNNFSSKKNILQPLAIALIILWLSSCANPGMPSGGEKDNDPPEVTNSEPENFSKNFKGEKIKIFFNEFVNQKNLSKQLLISPPMAEKPDIEFKGKYIQIELNCELLDSTTYTINFGDAIVDNNEGNALKDYQFVFATGDEIDSLQLGGMVRDAETDAPREGVLIMLYRNHNDSAPYNELPVYVSKTHKNGRFRIKNIADATFKIFALEDNNQNYLFDQPSENIAFIDSLIHPYAELSERTDTIHLDTLGNDSLVVKTVTSYYPDSILMKMFEEIYYKQYLKTKSRPERNKLVIAFNESLSDSFEARPLNFELNESNHIFDVTATRDSIIYWLKDTMITRNDSLLMLVNYMAKDSLNSPALQSDTILFSYREKKKKKDEKHGLLYTMNQKKTLRLDEKLELTFDKPLDHFDTSKISLLVKQDTVFNKMPYDIVQDSLDFKKYRVQASWDFAQNYQLTFDTLAFVSFDGLSHDSITYKLETKELEFYGKIIVNLKFPFDQGILILLDDKGKVLKEHICTNSAKFEFPLLEAKTFKLRFIYDKNKNGKWDTGNYLNKIHAENVYNYSSDITVKANWDMEFDWIIE